MHMRHRFKYLAEAKVAVCERATDLEPSLVKAAIRTLPVT